MHFCVTPEKFTQLELSLVQNLVEQISKTLSMTPTPTFFKWKHLQGPSWNYMSLSTIISLFAHETAKFFQMKDRVWRKMHSSGTSYLDPRGVLVRGNSHQHWLILPHAVKHLTCSFYRNHQCELRTNYLTYANLKVVYILSWQCCTTLNL